MSGLLVPGQVFDVDCPFIRAVYTSPDVDGLYTELTWKPGVEWEIVGPEGEADMRAHGMGKVRYTVVSIHKLPHPYPPRVFFTRRWIAPDGREFGKGKLHIMTKEAFRRRTVSYRPAGADSYTQLTVRDLDEIEKARLLA